MKTRRKFLWLLVVLAFIPSAVYAGFRTAGPYAGVVIFDRWGGCTLYSGIYVMYISEKVKQQLLPYKDKAIKINATEVFQPMNPGDGLIKKFKYLDPAPANPQWINIAGLKLKTSPDFKDGKEPGVLIEIANTGKHQLKILSKYLAPTLLVKQAQSSKYSPSDGPSIALITRTDLWISGSNKPRWEGDYMQNGRPAWSIGKSHALPEFFILKPNQKRQIKISFDLPEGEYDFLFGYGGGVHESQCVASNRTAFDVTRDGKGKIPTQNTP